MKETRPGTSLGRCRFAGSHSVCIGIERRKEFAESRRLFYTVAPIICLVANRYPVAACAVFTDLPSKLWHRPCFDVWASRYASPDSERRISLQHMGPGIVGGMRVPPTESRAPLLFPLSPATIPSQKAQNIR